MKLDLASFCFGYSLIEGTGTPPWGTSLGQHRPDYKFTHEGYENILIGMLYNSVPLKDVWMPIGRGGNIVSGSDFQGIQLASVFSTVFVNGMRIEHPFAMVIFKEASDSHDGRRHLKYSPKISFRDTYGQVHSNATFIKEVYRVCGLEEEACWFVSDMQIEDQVKLNMNAVFVNRRGREIYQNSQERKMVWQGLSK